MQETTTEVLATPEEPVAPPPSLEDKVEAQPLTEEPDSPEGQEEATTESEAPVDHASRWDEIQGDEALKEFFEERDREAERRGQLREFGQRQELKRQLDRLNSEYKPQITALNKTLLEVAERGGPEAAQAIEQAFEKHAPGLQAYNLLNAEALTRMQTNSRAGALSQFSYAIAKEFGLTDEAAQGISSRFASWQQTGTDSEGQPIWSATASSEFEFDGASSVLKQLKKDIAKAVGDPQFSQGKKAGQKAVEEAVKVAARDGKGPAAPVGSPGGGGRPTPQEYAAASFEQRQKWKADGIEPLA